ncbi:MAG: hypothetical protein ABI992_02735 [Chthoniobacterales bacterium]
MVTRPLIITAFSVLLALAARADLAFTPKESEYDMEGMKLKQLAFSDGNGKTITYQQPPGWKYSGNANSLILQPPNTVDAEGTITRVTLPQPGTFDEETMKKLTEEALASVPKPSSNVTLVSQANSPVRIGGKETFLVIVSYTFNKENYERSTMFLNRGNDQVRFQFVSRAAEFNELQRAFLGSQFTWQNL